MYLPATLQEWMDARWKNPEDFVWMQFTGLHDKNGKEIYEGDVMADKSKGVHKIWGGKELCVWVYWDETGRWSLHDNNESGEYSFTYKNWEVIGNICENPELIK